MSNHITRLGAVALTTLNLLACGVNQASEDTGGDTLAASSLELSSVTKPTGNPLNSTRYFIRHDQNWNVTQTADRPEGTHPFGGYTPGFFDPGGSRGLVAEAGKPLIIIYDHDERIIEHPPATCYDEFTGAPYRCSLDDSGWLETIPFAARWLHYRINGGEISTLEMPPGAPGVQIDLPAGAGGELEYWIEVKTTAGSTFWDSRYGDNYRVQVLGTPTATLTFDENWRTGVSGTVKAGQSVQINCDHDRLAGQLLRLPNPGPAVSASIRAYISFDGKPPLDVPVNIGLTVDYAPVVKVPSDVRRLSVWFKGNIPVYPPGQQWHYQDLYDSNHGANYTFSVMP